MTPSTSQVALLTYLLNYIYECPLYPRTNYDTACDLNLKNNQTYDFIVVGGGSAGTTIANRLSENSNWKILLIEAGDVPSNLTEAPGAFIYIQGTNENWAFKTNPGNFCQGFVDGRCKWPQGKTLGGGSSINAMLTNKGVDRDYNQWAAMGNPGWDWNSMQQYLDKLDTKMKTSKYDSVAPTRKLVEDSVILLGQKVNPTDSWTGFFDVNVAIWEHKRFNTAKGYIASARDRKNLCVLTKSQVSKILFKIDRNTKKVEATGVQLIDETKIYAKKEVIVTAGAINSPKLLMLSGIGPKTHLNSLNIPVVKDLPVGKNLQDHLAFLGYFIELPNVSIDLDYLEMVRLYCNSGQGPMGAIDLLEFVGFINTLNNSAYRDVQFHLTTILKNDSYFLPNLLDQYGFNQESTDSIIAINKKSILLLVIPILLNPESRGDIYLRNSDAGTPPLINPNYMSDRNNVDEETMLRGIDFLNRMVAQKPFVDVQAKVINFRIPKCQGLKFNTTEYWKCSLRNFGGTLYHASGACKMGPKNDSGAVVNSDLKVHGVDGLRVADSSIMPKVTSGNTNIPTIAIAEKASDLIKKDY